MGNFFGKKPQERTRNVFVNQPERHQYPNNKISNTKYSPLTFLPKNLVEQFGRFMNVYFLLIASLQLWSVISPVDPASTWVPLAIIFAISAIKEAVDDIKRYWSDKQANQRRYEVIRNKFKYTTNSESLQVGEIIYLVEGAELPCDVVPLKSSNEDGTLYITTANLDGETDFKPRYAPNSTQTLSENILFAMDGEIQCPPPNAEVNKFDSRIRIGDSHEFVPLNEKNLLPQGTHLKNTDWVFAVVVYTGNETKVGMNKTVPPVKWTKLDRAINNSTTFIFCLQLVLVFIFGTVGNVWQKQHQGMWFLSIPQNLWWWEYLVIPLRFLLLNSMMIPISLKVSLDLVKFFYAKLIDWDFHMYDAKRDIHANATSTAISEELGQIEYVFSDKTGTLTENMMILSRCSIGKTIYGENSALSHDATLRSAMETEDSEESLFFKILATCHTVSLSHHGDEVTLKASSPDEEALVTAASQVGIAFKGGDNQSTSIERNGKLIKMEKILVIDFTSDRKRMSVAFRQPDKSVLLFTKGADDVILKRLSKSGRDTSFTEKSLEKFAQMGLRTLCVACRRLSEKEYFDWSKRYSEASISLDKREELLNACFDEIETNLELIGATAIEDKLQDLVPSTIENLREAGIKVWMLTGDKYLTAIQIGLSCSLIERETLIEIRGNLNSAFADAAEKAKNFQNKAQKYSIIIEGPDLAAALTDFKAELLSLGTNAYSVICCRVTPKQKASVVGLIKATGAVTLAIGDGGNDVSMIQEAHVGIGIVGREGLQASRASDYSISKFKYLKRLLLVHGRYSYLRTAFVSHYSFYKSLFICSCQILFSFFNGFGGTSFFDTFCLTFYNVLFTSLPVMCYVLDKDLPEQCLMETPKLYEETRKGIYFNKRTLGGWFGTAFFQAFIIFLLAAGCFAMGTIDYFSLPIVVYTSLLIVNSFTIISESNNLTWLNHVVIWATLASYFVIMFIVTSVPKSSLYYVMSRVFSDPKCYLAIFLTSSAAILPIILYKTFIYFFSPSHVQALREVYTSKKPTHNSTGSLDMKSFEPKRASVVSSSDDEGDQTPLLRNRKNAKAEVPLLITV